MNEETATIGVMFNTHEDDTVLYISHRYDSGYPRWLAHSIVSAIEDSSGSVDKFRGIVIGEYLSYMGEPTMSAIRPETDHTIHIVDVFGGVVKLMDKEHPELTKVSFSFQKFAERYKVL